MSQLPPPIPPSPSGELQFDTAEPARAPQMPTPPTSTCVGCGRPIQDFYYVAGDKIVCPACRERYVATMTGGSGFGRFAKATVFGAGAGVVGAVIWYGVAKATGYTIGLIAVVVGFMVGTAVLKGSGGRGGRKYQILAVLLTYCSVCATYVPEIIGTLRTHASTETKDSTKHSQATQPATKPAKPPGLASGLPRPIQIVIAYGLIFVFALAMPFFGSMGAIGILILGFALWEAWKINRRRVADLAGPYTLMGTPRPMPGVM